MIGHDYETLLIEREGDLAWVVLNRPDRLNAISDQLLADLTHAFRQLAADDSKVIAIRGAGRAFSTGCDIDPDATEVGQAAERDAAADQERLASNIHRLLEIWDHPKPIIAAVHGYCLAGATQLCVFCDLTIVAEDAQIGMPSIPIGGGYIEPLWVPLVGPKRAKQMAFVAGNKIDGVTAAEWGWANFAVPEDELLEAVRELAGEISKMPADVLRVTKLAINRAMDLTGFRTLAPMVAEWDAVLHASSSVQRLQQLIMDHGLKEAIRRYDSRDW